MREVFIFGKGHVRMRNVYINVRFGIYSAISLSPRKEDLYPYFLLFSLYKYIYLLALVYKSFYDEIFL